MPLRSCASGGAFVSSELGVRSMLNPITTPEAVSGAYTIGFSGSAG